MHRSLVSSSNLKYFVFSRVECSGTRVKDIKFVTGVEDIPDFNFLAHMRSGLIGGSTSEVWRDLFKSTSLPSACSEVILLYNKM
jgi:hypothetical protein